jgi:uncharacterized protein YqeY
MVLKEDLQNDLQNAIRSGDNLKRDTLRMALTAIKLAEVEKRGPLDEAATISVLQKEAKVQQEAIEDAQKAGREDLIKQFRSILKILETYLPEPLTEEVVMQLAKDAILEVGGETPQDMGKVMGVLMPRIQGRMDGKKVSQIVRNLLHDG